MFLYLLAVVDGAAARELRVDRATETWRRAIGGVFLFVSVISFALGTLVGGPMVAPVDNPSPLVVLSVPGIVRLVAGWWLNERPECDTANPT